MAYATYTALYDTREEAERVQAQLQELGIIDADGNSLLGGDRHAAGDLDRDHWAGQKGAVPPEADRRLYNEGVKRGGYLLTVNVDEAYHERVHTLLEGSGAVDLAEREQQYRSEGVLPAAAPAATAAPATSERLANDETSIPIVEEQLKIGKRQVERGGVRVRSYVVETPVHEQVQLREEHVEIERRPVNQTLGAVPADAFREREIGVTERAEEAVVAKEARVVEEVGIHKEVTERTEEVADSVRRTEVEVEKLGERDRVTRQP